jgi:hypothetical protein
MSRVRNSILNKLTVIRTANQYPVDVLRDVDQSCTSRLKLATNILLRSLALCQLGKTKELSRVIGYHLGANVESV